MKQVSVPIKGRFEAVLYNLRLDERAVQRAAFAAVDLMRQCGHFNFPRVTHRPSHIGRTLMIVSMELVQEFNWKQQPANQAVVLSRPFDSAVIEIHTINHDVSSFSLPGPEMIWSPTGMIIRDRHLETVEIPRALLLEE